MRIFSIVHTYSNLTTLLHCVSRRFIPSLMLCLAFLVGSPAISQRKSAAAPVSSLCNRENALGIIRQQIDAATAIDDRVQRITVLIRAADLLWSYQQDKARATFADAFELAVQDFKEKGDQPKREGRALLVQTPDQRYVVIRAVAKRDPAWAKSLTERLLKKDAAEVTAKGTEADVRTAWKLLDSAVALLPADPVTAINFARNSLTYPASTRLTIFLYKLAESDQKAADQFYEQALMAYGDKPAREFLYLTAYPLGLNSSGDMPWTGTYTVPANFVPNSVLQRLFIQMLLKRANQIQQTPLGEEDNYNGFSGAGHILQVIDLVTPLAKRSIPDLTGELEQARDNLLASLSPESQELFLRPSIDNEKPPQTLDELIEAAKSEANADRRDELMATAILNADPSESLDRVISAINDINDSTIRSQLRDWIYFSRAQGAIKEKQVDEAGKLAAKVQEMDQRAYLYSEIAALSLQNIDNQNQARELLDDVVAAATKGASTPTAARALLSAAYSYSKIDPSRAMSILGETVKTINRIESPDFSRQSFVRRIEGRNFARYAVFKTPGSDPERVFSEMAKIDFDIAISQAASLTDRYLRSLTTLAIADFCLQRAEQQEKTVKPKKSVKS